MAFSENQESCWIKRCKKRDFFPDKPESVKTYHEAVAEQWAKKQIALYSFYRAISGSFYHDTVKWNSKFQPSVPQTGFVVQGCIFQNLICSLWMYVSSTSRLLRAEDCVSLKFNMTSRSLRNLYLTIP